jgi:hypothetical protein
MNAIAIMRSGARIDLDALQPRMVQLRDVAEALAKTPMYRGATQGFYSHAQHSTLLAAEVAPEEGSTAALYALLHHAHIAFQSLDVCIDLTAPPPTQKRRNAVMKALLHGCDLDWPIPGSILKALARAHDNVEMTELRQLCTGCDDEVAAHERNSARPLRGLIKPLGWDRALDRYIEALQVNAVASRLPKLPIFGDIL